MEDLEKEYGIKGRPLKLPLQRIAEDEEGGGFDLPPIPSHKNKFDSARSSAGPHFSSKAPHPGLRNLAKTMKCDPAASFSSEAGEESIEPESPSGKTSSTSRITTQSGGAGDEDSSEHMSALTESTSSVNTFVSVSSRIRDDNNCSSLISVASYHTAPTGPCFTQIGAEGVPVVASPSLSTAPCTSTNKSEVGRSKKIALATVQNNASNEQPAVEESIAIHSPKRDPEIASFKSAKAGTSNRYQPLLWVISWLTILVLLCTFIGKNHDPFAAPTLSGEKQDKTKRMVEANATSWVTFRHNATFAFSIQWPHNSILNVTASNATGSNTRSLVERDRVTPIAWRADSTETWNPMLYIEHVSILNSSWVTLNTSLTAEHRVNLTTVCPQPSVKDVKESSTSASSVKHSTSPSTAMPTISNRTDASVPSNKLPPTASSARTARPTTSTTSISSSQSPQLKETRAVTYTKNLLTCLWFLPTWLLAIFIAERCSISWLAQGESKVRMQITAVVVSLLLAAAVALATTEMVMAILEFTRST